LPDGAIPNSTAIYKYVYWFQQQVSFKTHNTQKAYAEEKLEELVVD